MAIEIMISGRNEKGINWNIARYIQKAVKPDAGFIYIRLFYLFRQGMS